MREFRAYGSVRGAPSNGCPYRDLYQTAKTMTHEYPRHPPAWPYKIHTFPQARQPRSMVFNRKKPLRITTGPGCP